MNIPDENIEQSEDLDIRRIRRRPYWAKDYVSSCRMSNIKQTPRKVHTMENPPKTRCTWCKGLFETGDKFERHMIQCYRSRWTCITCGRTFGKQSYLKKHRHNQHTVKSVSTIAKKVKKAKTVVFKAGSKSKDDEKCDSGTTPVEFNSEKKHSGSNDIGGKASVAKKTETVVKNEEDSDWKASPDVSVGGSENESDMEKSDGGSDVIGSVSDSDDQEVKKTVTLPLYLDSDDETQEERRSEEPVTLKEKKSESITSESERKTVMDMEFNVSLLKGRLFRKAMEPRRPIAPQKRKHEEATCSDAKLSKTLMVKPSGNLEKTDIGHLKVKFPLA